MTQTPKPSQYVEPAAETVLRREIMTRCPYVREDLRVAWHRAHRDYVLRRTRPELQIYNGGSEQSQGVQNAYHRGWLDAGRHAQQTEDAFASVVAHETARLTPAVP